MIVAVCSAVAAGVLLAVGSNLQNAALTPAEGRNGSPSSRVLALMRNRVWLGGTFVLVAAIALQLLSVSLAPITIVQPLGVTAIVVASIIRLRTADPASVRRRLAGTVLCVLGVTAFVVVASRFSNDRPPDDDASWQLVGSTTVLILGAGAAALSRALRSRAAGLLLTLAAAALFGCVVTLARVLLTQAALWAAGEMAGTLSPLTVGACAGVLVVAGLVGTVLVQLAHRRLPSDSVVAGLTVVDPMVAVTLGAVLLGEMAGTPLWALAALIAAAVVASCGVVLLSHLGKTRDPASAAVAG